MPTLIDATEIPGDDLDADAIETAARRIRHVGTRAERQGRTLVGTWRRLEHHYEAPEDHDLLAVMTPVVGHTATIGSDLAVVARALVAFAAEVRPVAAALAGLRTEADTFCRAVVGGVEVSKPAVHGVISTSTVAWNEDIPTVDVNNRLIGRVNDQVELLWAAERRCANAIRALTGEPPLTAGDRPGATKATAYGVRQITPGTPTDWGVAGDPDYSIPDRIVAASIEFGAETIRGASAPLGFDLQGGPLDWNWSIANAKDSVQQMASMAVGVATAVNAFSPRSSIAARTDTPAGADVRFQRKRTKLVVRSISQDALSSARADPVNFSTKAVLTVASLIVTRGAAAEVKGPELAVKAGRVAEKSTAAARRAAAAARISDDFARRAARAALETVQMSPGEMAATVRGLRHPDLALAPVGPKDLSLHMSDHGPVRGGDGSSPHADHPSPHRNQHHELTYPNELKRGNRTHDSKSPWLDPDAKVIRRAPDRLDRVASRRDEYESAPPRTDHEVTAWRGTMVREFNVALYREEWATADYFLDRGYHLLAMDESIGQRHKQTADFMIQGIGRVDVWKPDYLSAKHFFDGVKAKRHQADCVVVNLDDLDLDRSAIDGGLSQIWARHDTRTIQRVMVMKDQRLVLDALRPR